MADPLVPASELGEFKLMLREMRRRLDELEKPTGTQLSKAVEKIMELLDNLEARVDAAIVARSYTRAQIDAKRYPFSQIDGMVPIGQGGTGSGNVYNQDLALYTRRAAWVADNGLLGFAVSLFSRKQNVQDADLPWLLWLSLPVQAFQYRGDAGSLTGWDLGFIAEDVAALGLEQWLYRAADGSLEGVAYERLSFAHHEALRSHEVRVQSLESTVAAQAATIADLVARVAALEERGVF